MISDCLVDGWESVCDLDCINWRQSISVVLVFRQDARPISSSVGLDVQIHLSSSFFSLPTGLDEVNRQNGLDMTEFKDILD